MAAEPFEQGANTWRGDMVSPVSHLDRLLNLNDIEALTQSCCKRCNRGKACGDSCISRSYTCHKGPGCACNG